MRPTIKDVAALAGTSTATVSRVINKRGTVSPEYRRRVEEVLEKLDYYPDSAARNLACSRSNTIMFLVNDISMTFYAQLAKSISHIFHKSDIRVFLGDMDNSPKMEAYYLTALKGKIADGVIATPITPPANAKLYLDLLRRKIPIVLVDSYLEGLSASYVVVDNIEGAYNATKYLFDKGHSKIAFICGDMNMQTNLHRYEGYLKALREHGVLPRPEYCKVNSIPLIDGAVKSTEELLELHEPPTAIFAANDTSAIACMSILQRREIEVPGRIAVMGYDNLHESAFSNPPLTTIAQPISEIAEKAVKILMQQIEKRDEQHAVIQHRAKPQLIIRESA